MIERYARSAEVRFEFSHFSVGPQAATLAALAATAAGEQGRQWQFIDLAMRNLESAGARPTTISSATWRRRCPSWSSSSGRRTAARRSPRDRRRRRPAGGGPEPGAPTPAVIVSGPGGYEQLEDSPREEIEAAIEAVG